MRRDMKSSMPECDHEPFKGVGGRSIGKGSIAPRSRFSYCVRSHFGKTRTHNRSEFLLVRTPSENQFFEAWLSSWSDFTVPSPERAKCRIEQEPGKPLRRDRTRSPHNFH